MRITIAATAHNSITMEESVIIDTTKRTSATLLFFVSVLATVALGTVIAYCSGIMSGINRLGGIPFGLPDWLVITIPPVLFLHMGLALFFVLRREVKDEMMRAVRTWTWVMWSVLMLVTAFTPYFIFHNMPVASFVMATIMTAFAIGTTILCYRQSIAAGVIMTVFLIVSALIMIYLAYWALV